MIATGRRLPQNAWGPYFVTDECDGCGVCTTYAPVNFEPVEDGSRYYVVRQPFDDWEEESVHEAIEACPRRCIRAAVDDEGWP